MYNVTKPIATVVLFFHYAAGVDFSATFPAADLFTTCYRYALAVKQGYTAWYIMHMMIQCNALCTPRQVPVTASKCT